MSVIAKFRLDPEQLVLASALEAVPEMSTSVDHEIGEIPSEPLLFFWAWGGDFEAFEAALEDDPTVTDVLVLDKVSGRRLYRVQLTSDTPVVLYPMYARLGLTLLDAHASADGWTGRIRFPGREALAELRAFFVENDVSFDVIGVYDQSDLATPGPLALTDGQRQILEVALESGYFEIPRDASLSGVAASLGISPQAASERLRRGLQTVVERSLRERPDR